MPPPSQHANLCSLFRHDFGFVPLYQRSIGLLTVLYNPCSIFNFNPHVFPHILLVVSSSRLVCNIFEMEFKAKFAVKVTPIYLRSLLIATFPTSLGMTVSSSFLLLMKGTIPIL